MDCGSSDLLCYVFGLFAQYVIELSAALKWWPWLEERVVGNLQAIIGLAGFSFGLWKWWYFRERVLHKRLKEYLQHQDERLLHARSYVLEALYRPGAIRRFAEPLFTVRPLRRVLRRKGWSSLLLLARLETGADHLLNKALRRLESRLEAAEGQMAALRRQQASAHFLKGAIASARADAGGANSPKLDYRSLDAFRAALQVPGHDADLELMEYEAHQLRKLGYLNEAEQRYRLLEERAPSIAEPQERDLFLARVKRWQAVIVQAQTILRSQIDEGGRGSGIADGLVRLGDESSISLRRRYAPFQGWDGLEQGDLHYFSAFVCSNLGFKVRASLQLGLAETEYRRVLNNFYGAKWRISLSSRRLHRAAKAGVLRVHEARVHGAYDEKWLLPPLDPVERPASEIGEGGNKQAVKQAAEEHHVEGSGQS
jgi:hypothetical protein